MNSRNQLRSGSTLGMFKAKNDHIEMAYKKHFISPMLHFPQTYIAQYN